MATRFDVKMKKGTDPIMQGFALAVADIVRLFDNPTVAAGIIAGHGFRLSAFDGVDEYDLKVIRQLYKTETALIGPGRRYARAAGHG